ncbi:MAG: nucleoside hydrolase [Pseudomonadota bacterium]
MTQTRVIIDTDPGIDDAMAILYLAAHPEVKIEALTTVFGNSDVLTTARNAAYLVTHFTLDVPVFVGAAEPIVRPRHISQLKVHGADAFGDTHLAATQALPAMDVPACDAIIAAVRASPGAITLLALGPLTNLAMALQKAPDIACHVAGVVCMGGAFGNQNRSGNIRPHAEANIFYDPEAAERVCAADWPVTMIGLDVTLDCILPAPDAAQMAEMGHSAARFLYDISRGYEALYIKRDGALGCCLHDVVAAVYLTRPELFDLERAAIRVKTSGQYDGQTKLLHQAPAQPIQAMAKKVSASSLLEDYKRHIFSFD